VIDDDDGLEDGSEMAIDTQSLLGPGPPPAASGANLGAPPVPPPPPEMPFPPVDHHPQNESYPASGNGHLPEVPLDLPAQRSRTLPVREDEDIDSMDVSPAGPSATGASTAPVGTHGEVPHPGSFDDPGQASGVTSVTTEGGPSTANIQGQQRATPTSGQGHQNLEHNDER
jgi:F-box and leucine-rich repeat protein GRR1